MLCFGTCRRSGARSETDQSTASYREVYFFRNYFRCYLGYFVCFFFFCCRSGLPRSSGSVVFWSAVLWSLGPQGFPFLPALLACSLLLVRASASLLFRFFARLLRFSACRLHVSFSTLILLVLLRFDPVRPLVSSCAETLNSLNEL